MSFSPEFADWIERARGSDIVEVAQRFGAKLRRSGPEWVGACPQGCSTSDGFAINKKDRVFICRKGGAQGDVISMVEHLGGYDFKGACEFLTGEPPPRGSSTMRERDPEIEKERREERRDADISHKRQEAKELDDAIVAATDFFNNGRPIFGTIVEDYLERRGILDFMSEEIAADLRFIPSLPYYGFRDRDAEQEEELGHYHCMIAAIRDVQDRIIGVHRTYLDKAEPIGLRPPGDRVRNKKKKILRKSKGGLIRLGPIGETLAVGEGIETTLSFRRLLLNEMLGDKFLDASYAAGISLGNMAGSATGSVPHPKAPRNNPRATITNGEPDMDRPGMILPPQVKRVLLVGDGDSETCATHSALLTAKRRFERQGLEALIWMAPSGMDGNDALLSLVSEGAL